MISAAETEERLLRLLQELESQPAVGASYRAGMLGYPEEMAQLREYIELAGEYAIAYESIVATLECHPFILTANSAIALLELGLTLGYKTDRQEDAMFDRRNNQEINRD